jgi:diguanylate cyclase (GGDEF)-like protein
LEDVLLNLDEQVRAAAGLLSVQIGCTANYAQVQADAAVRLAQLSMEAEIERNQSHRREIAARMDAERLQVEKEGILEAASTDGLTKVANRAAFDRRLSEEVHRAKSNGGLIGLIMLDVDHFKKFNDTHGHQAGDEVLRHVAGVLKEVGEKAGYVARYGGEEFAVIVTQEAVHRLPAIADEIRCTIESREVEFEGRWLKVTASLGGACVNMSSQEVSAKQLIEVADRLLYRAKENGRNRAELAA